MNKKTTSFFISISLIIIVAALLFSCDKGVREGTILMTAINPQLDVAPSDLNKKVAHLEGAEIVMFDPAHPNNALLSVSKEFYSAAGPSISFDAQEMLFSAQKFKGDSWQIYEMKLSDLKYAQLSDSKSNCYQPVYLPGKRIVYSKETMLQNGEMGHALFVIDKENSTEERITFSPGSYLSSKVLHDGRLITLSQQEFLDKGRPNLMVMRPDGTKEMRFYNSKKSESKILSANQATNGDIYLLESNKNDKVLLSSITYANPMASRKNLSKNIQGDIISAYPMPKGNLLICYKKLKDEQVGLYEFDPVQQQLVRTIYKDKEYTFLEAVQVSARTRPKKIPSEVKIEEKTALLLCQDINFTGRTIKDDPALMEEAVSIEVLGLEMSMGVVDVEQDGSVYLEVKADTPFKIQTLDKNGNILYGPSSWINLRPNERRACVGCHLGNEIVPENRQPLAVTKDPIQIPKVKTLLAKTE